MASVIDEDVCSVTKTIDPFDILNYLKNGQYPEKVVEPYQKSNFRTQCKPYFVRDDKLYYKKKLKRLGEVIVVEVITDNHKIDSLIKMAHEGADTSEEAVGVHFF